MKLARQWLLLTTMVGLLVGYLSDIIWKPQGIAHHRKRANQLVNALIKLGPTFIKIGQALSTRIDLLPPVYIDTLGELQDRVPPFPSEMAIGIVERELGKSINQLYQDFDSKPLASASLGQVHRATLFNGEQVVVKVQRPGLDRLFRVDFQIIGGWVRFFHHWIPSIRTQDLPGIYQEFCHFLYQEIDYLKEGENIDRFRQNFQNSKSVTAPYVYWQYTTSKVLTMTYLPGIKVTDRRLLTSCGLNPQKINQIGICCYLQQLLVDGFFQADPHPGNMAVTTDGKLILYDFGMMAEVKSLSKRQMVDTFFAVVNRDPDTVTNCLMDLGLLCSHNDIQDLKPVKNVVSFLLERFTEKPLNVQEFNEIQSELYTLFKQQPFRLTAEMTFILRALGTLDGIARSLDPQYNLILAAQPFIRTITVGEKRNILSKLGQQATQIIKYKLTRDKTFNSIKRETIELTFASTPQPAELNHENNQLKRIYRAIKSLTYLVFSGFTTLIGILLFLNNYLNWAIFCAGLALFGAIALIRNR